LIAKNIVPSQLPGFSASWAAHANEGAATTAAIANSNPALFGNFINLKSLCSKSIRGAAAGGSIERPTEHALSKFRGEAAPHLVELALRCLEFLFYVRVGAIQGRPRAGFRCFENLCRLGLSLAPLRFATGAHFTAHCEDALFALLLRGLGQLNELLGTLAQVLESLFSPRQQIQKRAKKYPAEYKPKNEEGNNQRAEGSPIRWDMHIAASPLSRLLKNNFTSLRPQSCLSQQGEKFKECSQFPDPRCSGKSTFVRHEPFLNPL
jgi:hypothetical protein